ncbi:polysaccharide export protein [Bradyrhizobium lablabi]|nr:polysaccharide export protein [Bradyrhizobium lablabi]
MKQRSVHIAALSLLSILCLAIVSGIGGRFAGSASAQTQGLAPAPSASSYVLGSNDRIRLRVYGEPDISGEYEVDASGHISVPLAGPMKAAGTTTRELERSIKSALSKGIVRDPRVNVEIIAYRPYYILGEVKKSGEYPYRLGLTVLDAVASAGGFTYRANENKVYLRRAGTGVEETYALDAPVPVFPGDNIRVPERYF